MWCLHKLFLSSIFSNRFSQTALVVFHRNVHHALHQECPWGTTAAAAPAGIGNPHATPGVDSGSTHQNPHHHAAGDEIGIRNDAAFHAYLWATMERHPRECRKDWCVARTSLVLPTTVLMRAEINCKVFSLDFISKILKNKFVRCSKQESLNWMRMSWQSRHELCGLRCYLKLFLHRPTRRSSAETAGRSNNRRIFCARSRAYKSFTAITT